MNNTYEISYTSKHKNEYNFEIKEMSEDELEIYIDNLKLKGNINIEIYSDDELIYLHGEFTDYHLTT
jgi:hypothetical protein